MSETAQRNQPEQDAMGLDITSYSTLNKTQISPMRYAETSGNGLFLFRKNEDFPDHAAELTHATVYKFEKSFSFKAGSYSGYNEWREKLAKLADYPVADFKDFRGVRELHSAGAWAASGGPFWELISFTDCDGAIGPAFSAKLAKDFEAYDEGASALFDDYFNEIYRNFRHAFELASEGGAVEFH